jgi:hypothetical protein
MHHPDALPQRDPRPRPAQDGLPVFDRLRYRRQDGR